MLLKLYFTLYHTINRPECAALQCRMRLQAATVLREGVSCSCRSGRRVLGVW